MYREVSDMPRCVCCGILIPAQAETFVHHSVELYACSERCIRVYGTYKYPRYEKEIRAAEQAGQPASRFGYVATQCGRLSPTG
jgi:hypothetical protein